MSQRGVSQREAEGRCRPGAVGSPKVWQPVPGTPGSWGSLRALEAEQWRRGRIQLSRVLHQVPAHVSPPVRVRVLGGTAGGTGDEHCREQSGVRVSQPLLGRVSPCSERQWGVQSPWATSAGLCPGWVLPGNLPFHAKRTGEAGWKKEQSLLGQRGIRGRSLLSRGEEPGWGGCCTALGHSCRNPV